MVVVERRKGREWQGERFIRWGPRGSQSPGVFIKVRMERT